MPDLAGTATSPSGPVARGGRFRNPSFYAAAGLVLVLTGALMAGCKTGADSVPPVTRAVPAGSALPSDPVAEALVTRLTTPRYSGDTTAAMVTALAHSGIATFADPVTTVPEQPVTGPASALRLLDFQVHALAVGAWAGAGFTGAELDAVLPQPPGLTGMPTTSELLAGYVAAAGSRGGALSRALMTGQNLLVPVDLRFPAVVLVLFAADLATPGAGAQISSGTGDVRAVTGRAIAGGVFTSGAAVGQVRTQRRAGICSTTANWISDVIAGLFNSLRLATPDSVPGAIAASIWNWLVSVGEAFVQNLISTVTDAVLGTIRSIAASVAAVAEQIASLLPYAVKVVASGPSGGGTFTLGSEPLPGTFTASVTAGDLPAWPSVLADCAAVAQVKLADFHARDVPVTWGPIDPPAGPLLNPAASAHLTEVTDSAGQSSWAFQTATDPGDPDGEQRNQVDTMPVAVHRPEIDRARERLTGALLGFVPGLLRPYVAAVFKPYIDGLQGRLNTLLDARGRGAAILVFHAGVPPTPHPSAPGPSASVTCASGSVPAGTYSGTNTNTFVETIGMTGGGFVDHNDATGPVTLIVAGDGSVSGTWSYRSREVTKEDLSVAGVSANYDSVRTWAMTGGTLTGSVCDLAPRSGDLHLLSCTGTCGSGQDPDPGKQAGLLPLGAPVSVASGRVTWRWHAASTADATYSDTFTVTITLP